jgi:hypothetical protein
MAGLSKLKPLKGGKVRAGNPVTLYFSLRASSDIIYEAKAQDLRRRLTSFKNI